MGLSRYRIQDEGFDYFKEVQLYIESFLFYASEINKCVQSEIAAERDRYADFVRGLKTDPTWGEEYFMYELDLKTKEGLADIYMDSLVISLYSFVERKMLFLCEYFERGQLFKVSDIAGKGIRKYRLYLEGVTAMDFTPIEAEWKAFERYNELRNILVHQVGTRIIPAKNQRLIDFLKTAPGVELTTQPGKVTFAFKSNELLFTFFRTSLSILDFLFLEKVRA